MSVKDINSEVRQVLSLIPAAAISATTTGEVVDMAGAAAGAMLISTGALGSLSSTDKWTLKVYMGDLANGGDLAAIPDADYSSGVDQDGDPWDRTLTDGTADAEKCFQIGFSNTGLKRYASIVAVKSASAGNILIAGQILKGGLSVNP